MITLHHRVHHRSRHLRIAVHSNGRVVVTRPRRLSLREADVFVQDHREWIDKQIQKQSTRPRNLMARGNRADYLRLREKARELVTQRLEYFVAIYGLKYASVSIRDQKSRWGSCSHKKNLSFNYRIAVLPPELADYLIVHEICHLREMNHSVKFWQLVARTTPDFRDKAKKMKHIIGPEEFGV